MQMKKTFRYKMVLDRFIGVVDNSKVFNQAGFADIFNFFNKSSLVDTFKLTIESVFTTGFRVFDESGFDENYKMRQVINVKYSTVVLALLAMLYCGVSNALAIPEAALNQQLQAISLGFDEHLTPISDVGAGLVCSGASSGSPVDLGRQANAGGLVDSSDKFDSSDMFDSSKSINIMSGESVRCSELNIQVLLAYREGDFPGVGSEEKWKESQAYFNKGYASTDKAQSIKYIQQAIDIYPYESDYWNQLGTYMKTQEEQLVYYKKAVELNPDFVLAYTNVAGAYKLLGNHEKAIEWYKKAICVDNSDFHLYEGVADEYFKLKKYNEALPYAIQATKVTTNNVDSAAAIGSLGECYDELKEYDKALDCYFKSLALDPNVVYVIEDVGLYYKRIGNNKLAEEYKAKALEKCKNQEQIDNINSDFAKMELRH